MSDLLYMSRSTAMAMMMQQAALQQELIETQRKLIETQQQLAKTQKELIKTQKKMARMVPENPKDEDVIWHIHSGGIMSDEAANSRDIQLVRKFSEWIDNFGRKYIKPYVNPKVYMECHNQMTRGLPDSLANLQTREDFLFLTRGREDDELRGANIILDMLEQ